MSQLCHAAGGNEAAIDDADMVNAVVADLGVCSSYIARHLGRSRIIGFALYEPQNIRRAAPENTAWVAALAVDKNLRGQGVGQYLINHLGRVATGDGAEAIRLRARADERVIRFYMNNGFEIEDDQVMPVMRRDI